MRELIEVYRNSVQTWEIDQMGHMNVQFYVDKATAGLAVLGQHLGLGPEFTRREGARLVTCDQHIRFLREQRAGAPLRLRAGVLAANARRLRVYLELTNPASGEVAATFINEAELLDVTSREPRPLPEAVLERAERLRAELPDYAAPRGLELTPPRPAPRLEEADALGMLATYLGPVQPTMCDLDGRLATRAYMGIVSDSIPNLLVETLSHDRSQSKIGGAALEYRFVYHRAPRPGDIVTVCSAVRAIAAKTYNFCHWLFDAVSGEAIATAEAVAIMFDLQARKAIPIPDEARARLERFLIPSLSV